MSEHENQLPATILNEVFVDRLDNSTELVKEIVFTYVKDRLEVLCPKATEVETRINREANLMVFSVSGLLDGRKVNGQQEWTIMQLLTSNYPVTKLIEEVIRRVFEVPLEGTPVS